MSGQARSVLKGQFKMQKAIREILITVAIALLIFTGVRFVTHNYEVLGFSMEPNLHSGQRVFVSKAAYWFGEPQRGDVVVFDTARFSQDIIHRIVGLPGEMAEIRAGEAYIDGRRLEEAYIQGRSLTVALQKVPDNSYFIVGDNRGIASWDIVPRDRIIGKAWLRYWPLSQFGTVGDYWAPEK